MTKEEYGDFVLRYKGCGACFPMYHTLSRFEKMWFSAIQKDVADLEKENKVLAQNLEDTEIINKALEKENAELKEKLSDVQMQKAGEKSDLVWKLKTANEQKTDQLTKAKEHIENLLYYVKQCTCERSNYEEIEKDIKEAKQFLSEVEE